MLGRRIWLVVTRRGRKVHGRREPDHTAAHNLAKGVAALSIVLVDTPGKEY